MTKHQIFSYFCRRAGLPFGATYFQGLREVQLGKTPYQALQDISEQCCFESEQDGEHEFETWNQELQQLKSLGAKVTCPTDADYPQKLLSTPEPPLCLSYIGEPVWAKLQTLSVVGTREPSRDARFWMECVFSELLKNNELAIVSGAARGIDCDSHRMALRCHRPTVAFLPCGLDHIYPKDFVTMMDDIVRTGGAVVSEYPPAERMQKVYFHERNRLISGVSEIVLVVQAKIRSGSMITANHAIRQGRTVAAVPWSPLDVYSDGTNQLLHDGANVVRNHLDLEVLLSLHKQGYQTAISSKPF